MQKTALYNVPLCAESSEQLHVPSDQTVWHRVQVLGPAELAHGQKQADPQSTEVSSLG